jgi:hypothetical protein
VGQGHDRRDLPEWEPERGERRPVRLRRAIERRNLWLAEEAARELPNLPLEDALQLVRLYAERGSPNYEKAAMRWLCRCLAKSSPTLRQFAEIAADPAQRDADGSSREHLPIEERKLEAGGLN